MRVDEGVGLRADIGPARPAIAGRTVAIDVVVDSAADADLSLSVAGREVRVAHGELRSRRSTSTVRDPVVHGRARRREVRASTERSEPPRRPSSGSRLPGARAGRSPTLAAGPGSRRACWRSGTSITGRSSTATT